MTITQIAILVVTIVLLFFVVKFLIKSFVKLIIFAFLAAIAVGGYIKFKNINIIDEIKAYVIERV